VLVIRQMTANTSGNHADDADAANPLRRGLRLIATAATKAPKCP